MPSVENYKQVSILLVDDDDVDTKGILRAFKKLQITNPVVRAKDGREGLKLLRDNVVTKPRVVLLDLNMPSMNGFEFLEEIRNDFELQDTVIFVLTTSKSEDDIVAAYRKNVAGYIVKNGLDASFRELIDMLTSYWRIVELPIKPKKS